MTAPGTTAIGTWSGGRYMAFGQKLSEEQLLHLYDSAYEQGVRTFITADVYGCGEADELLGKALANKPRDSYCLVGAVGHDFYNGKRNGAKGFTRFTDPSLRSSESYYDYIQYATELSLKRCGVSSFDLLLLHNPDSIGFTSSAVWEGLTQVRDSGLTTQLGVAPGPANGFTLDLINSFERFGDAIDWAMIILNPFEPWPGGLCLQAAAAHGVKIITRVVDYGGIFHDDVQPGHTFAKWDHRKFRPGNWIETGREKLDQLRPLMKKYGLTALQLACQWNLSQPQVETVVPTLIQEIGDGSRPIEDKLRELANLPTSLPFNENDLALINTVGDNAGCMPLKGGTTQYQGPPQPDQWQVTPALQSTAERWQINPDKDLFYPQDHRDLRERGLLAKGQISDRRLYVQLHCFTGCTDLQSLINHAQSSELNLVVYEDVNNPTGVGILTLTEDPDVLVSSRRQLLQSHVLNGLTCVPDMTMLGRTYAVGHETDVEYWLLRRPLERAFSSDGQWAVWYPLRRKPSFYQLSSDEQRKVLMEHAHIGRNFAEAGYVEDIRLECFGLDRNDSEFVLGLVGPRLDWLSKLVKAMRPTVQTSTYIDSLGPFFTGRRVWHSSSISSRSMGLSAHK